MRCGLLGSLGAAFAVALSSSAFADSPLDKLNVWQGDWRVEAKRFDTPFSHASVVTYDAHCAWQPNRTYMVCDFLSQGVDPQRGAVANNLSLFYYSAVDKAYKHTGMGTEGGPHEQTVAIDGNTWTTPMEIPRRSGGMADSRLVYRFLSPSEYTIRMEISIDKGAHWTLLSESLAKKVG